MVLSREFDMSISLFDYCVRIAEQRHKQKQGYRSHRPLSNNYELVGILGEVIYGFMTGELYDSRLKIAGDDGFDFQGRIQVKASEKKNARHLIDFVNTD